MRPSDDQDKLNVPPLDPGALDPTDEGGLTTEPRPWRMLGGLFGRAPKPVVASKTAIGLTADGRLKSGRLAGLSMWSAIFVLSWPVLVENFLHAAVGLTDTALASRLPNGEAALDAIGGASYIMWFIGLTIMAIGIGATALISRSVGKGRLAVASAVLGQTALLAMIVGVIVGTFVFFMGGPIASLLGMSVDASLAFDQYLGVIALGVPAASLQFALIACARGAGDTIRPLQAMIVRNLVNISMSWLLSGVSLGGFASPLGLDLGVTGIAMGTVCGDIAGVIVVLRMATSGRWGIRLMARRMRPHWHTIRRLIRLGVPNFFETLGLWLGNFMVIVAVGWLAIQTGRDGLLGAHVVALRIESFSFMPGFAMGAAAATLCGQYLGAGAPELAGRAVRRCATIAACVMGLIGFAYLLIPRLLVIPLSTQPVHLEYSPDLLFVCGFIQVPFALGIVLRSAMRGAGDVRTIMGITWFSTYLVRLPLAYFASGVDIPLPESLGGGVIENPFPYDWGIVGLWIGLCSEHVFRAALFTARFVHGGWKRVKV